MSLEFLIGDRNDSGGGGGFLETLLGAAPGIIQALQGPTQVPSVSFSIPGVTGPPIFPGIAPALGLGGAATCGPIEVRRQAMSPAGPSESSVWKRVEGCADTWARVPRGQRPVRDDCGNVVLKKARARRRAAVTAGDVKGARRVTRFVKEFGVKSTVPSKRKRSAHRR